MDSTKILQNHHFNSLPYSDMCNYMYNVDILNFEKSLTSKGRHVKWQVVIMVFQLL